MEQVGDLAMLDEYYAQIFVMIWSGFQGNNVCMVAFSLPMNHQWLWNQGC